MSSPEIIRIRELDVDTIRPYTKDMADPEHYGTRLIVIGKPGSGKTTLIDSLMYQKSHIIPVGLFMSGTEENNHFYASRAPEKFIFSEFNEDAFNDFVERQKTAREHLPNPWALVILDDVTDDPKSLKTPLMQSYFKLGRHWKMFFILSLQYALDVLPSIRTSADGVFILRDPIAKNRKILYENYASIIPSFDMFNQMMDQLTTDYCAIYINNQTTSNKLEDCVFYYTATPVPENFKFGCYEYFMFKDESVTRAGRQG